MGSVTPLVEPLSLDEAFLDVTASQKLFGAPAEVARRLRARIRARSACPRRPASRGQAGGEDRVRHGEAKRPAGGAPDGGAAFLAPLPVSRLWGVGPKSARALATMGLEIVGDIARRDPDELARRLGPSGRALWEQANAIDPRPVIPDRDAKSIGAEETFDEDSPAPRRWRRAFTPRRCGSARRLRAAGLRARTVQLKLKRADSRWSRAARRWTKPPTTARCSTGRPRRCWPASPRGRRA